MWCSGPNITRVTCLPVCVVVHQGRVSVPTQVTPSKGDTCMLPAAFLCMCGTVHQGRVSVSTQVTPSKGDTCYQLHFFVCVVRYTRVGCQYLHK